MKKFFCCCLYDRAIGTFSRALDSTSAVRQPSLHMSAAAASRDITLVSRFFCSFLAAVKNKFLCYLKT